jgi:2',3'-cyclic-nucleotide 2'-phosphodiesterase
MTRPHAGILGRRADRVLPAVVTFVPVPFDIAAEDVRLGGPIVEIDPATGMPASKLTSKPAKKSSS